MPKPCSLELRERVVNCVKSGASRREAADWFDVSPSSAIKWMQRRQATVTPFHHLSEDSHINCPLRASGVLVGSGAGKGGFLLRAGGARRGTYG